MKLRPADTITALFSLLLLLIAAVFYNKIPSAPYLILIYASLIFFQIILVRLSKLNSFINLTRDIIFPVIAVLIIFESLEGVVHYINPKDIDPLLIKLDYLLFNGYPTVMLEGMQTPFLTDILQISYSTYYFLPIGLGVLLKIKGMDREFDKTLFMILLCFYLSYIGYMLFPALGPRHVMNHLHSSELNGLFATEVIQETLNSLEGIKRDAFPSGHTGVALAVSALAYRFHKGFFYVTLPIITLLIFSTVYCRYHYVIDVIAGIALTLITFIIGEKYYAYRENSKDIDR